jgi:predicted Zn-dependent protease
MVACSDPLSLLRKTKMTFIPTAGPGANPFLHRLSWLGNRLLPVLVLLAALALSGCESSEEKAERYYQSALTLMQAGDVDRALIELRNVFKYDGFHKEARQLYADTQLSRGEVAEAYSQYLRLVEQYPDTLSARITLAELALERGNWEEVERHGGAAIALAPEDPRVQAIAAALDYRKAVLARDSAGATAAANEAETLLKTEPDNKAARRIAVDGRLQGKDPQSALPLIDEALALDPKDLEFRMLRFRLLLAAGDTGAAGAELEATYAMFPDRPEVRDTLIRWYFSQNDLDGAEALLRRLAGEDTGPLEEHVTLVRFLEQARGRDAAVAELDRLIAATEGLPQRDLYRAVRAGLEFDTGKQDSAIAEMQGLLKDATPSDQTRRIKLLLARMLMGTGNQVGARELIETVLAEDPGQVDGLKMRAGFLIQEDKPDAAILDLRTALNNAPRDPDILVLMADAHLRAGSRDLAGERLALAVEVSGSAPQYALRYAQFLLQDGRAPTAESVLVAARRTAPDNLPVLQLLSEIWLRQNNWPALQDLLKAVREIDTDAARSLAINLEAAMLMGQDRTEEGLAVLAKEADGGGGDEGADRALSVLVLSQLRNGEIDAARAAVDAARQTRPDSVELRLLSAMIDALSGKAEAAEAELRALIADAPQAEMPVRRLVALLVSQGRHDEAVAALDAGIAAQPRSVALRLLRAGVYQEDGDFDKAIALHETLYAEDSSNLVVANNLASLLADHRDDAASLDRAYTIARRLSGMKVPAFQDTFGWIEYRRGNYEAALPPLQAAAEGLPNDPLVQVHLGLAYVALGRGEEARTYLERGLEIAGDRELPKRAEARAALEALGPPPPATGPTPRP